MKVLQVVNSLSAGGAEVFVTHLSIALRKICDVEVFTFYGLLDKKGESLKNLLIENNIKYSNPNYIKKGTIKKLICPLQLYKKINETKPDIIHVHLDQCELYTYLASLLPGHNPCFIRTIHNIKRSKRVPKVLWRSIDCFFDYSVHCSVDSSTTYEYLGKAHKYSAIDNGILLPSTKSLKINLKDQTEKIILLNIGSFTKRFNLITKGQDLLIEALPGLKDLPLKIVFLGDGKEKEKMASRAKELGVFDMVEFAGQITDPYQYIKSADAVIMPSRVEGLPISTIETVCSGIPLISSDIPAFKAFCSNSTLFFKSESISGLQKEVRKFFDNIVKLKESALINSENYRKRFDIRFVAEKYMEIYCENFRNNRG